MGKVIFDMGARNPRGPEPLEFVPIIQPGGREVIEAILYAQLEPLKGLRRPAPRSLVKRSGPHG